ncbi:hypothetical protein BDE02_07G065300 [Populus trichocarpa]|nr:hypothetical protein BDE02_07G065300 [Populus trichocarpa]
MPKLEDDGVALESFPSALLLFPSFLFSVTSCFLSYLFFFFLVVLSLGLSILSVCLPPVFCPFFFLSFSFCFSSEKIPPSSFPAFSSTFYRLPCCLSPQGHDKAWGHCVSAGLGHQQSCPCRTVGGGFRGLLAISWRGRDVW